MCARSVEALLKELLVYRIPTKSGPFARIQMVFNTSSPRKRSDATSTDTRVLE